MFNKIIAAISLLALTVGCNSVSNPVPTKPNIIKIPDAQITSSTPLVPEGKRRLELLHPLFHSMVQQEIEKLPFDEPRFEMGRQLDGDLRPKWEKAYFKGQKKYAFEATSYNVIDSKQHLLVPQVCADFIVDAIDRAAGTWYSSDLKHPQRIIGKFDFRDQIKRAGFEPRNANQLIKYFKTRSDDFNLVFEGDGPEVGDAEALKQWMHQEDIQLGDIVIIRGKAPWDHGKEIHYHSMFITRIDDATGLVTMIMGNAAYPTEWSVEREVKRAPKRHVIAIIRMTDKFLDTLQ